MSLLLQKTGRAFHKWRMFCLSVHLFCVGKTTAKLVRWQTTHEMHSPTWTDAVMYQNFGLCCVKLGQYDTANEMYQQAKTMHAAVGDSVEQGVVITNSVDHFSLTMGPSSGS